MNIYLYLLLTFSIFSFGLIIWNYAKGLKDSPREIWILFLAKLIEYAAYGASNMAFVLYLSSDCGLGDISAGTYIGTWSVFMTSASIFVGSVVDAIGIRKTLLIGIGTLLFGRLFMPFTNELWIVSLFSFVPIAIGNALLGPVLSVGIKKYTSGSSTALGFGLFYTMMNVGFALGGYLFDKVRQILGEHTFTVVPIINTSISTYQFIFLICFLLTLPTLVLILFIRDGVEVTLSGAIEIQSSTEKSSNTFRELFSSIKKSFGDTLSIMRSVFFEKSFWIYLFMLGILVFIKLVFYHFHYTFPKYGIRILGEGTKVGSLYGIVNPVIIIFLVPVVSHFTKNIVSFTMLLVGTTISTVSIFLCTVPNTFWSFLLDTAIGNFLLNDWMELPPERHNPALFGILAFVVLFSIGESIWSPRLLQLAAEIAPKGREGTYIALSYLPYFLAKMIAGPLSGYLLAIYTPANALSYPESYMVWVWIGGMSAVSPIGLVVFRRFYVKDGG